MADTPSMAVLFKRPCLFPYFRPQSSARMEFLNFDLFKIQNSLV
jgi:hypothetical protein